MEQIQNEAIPSFLAGDGEMAELMRSYNWANSSLGTPDEWPLSLKTTIGVVLHSAFPMFLFWGRDLICFYNDAFRPSLGVDGKHPAIGKSGKDVWGDIWEQISPWIYQVMETGKPVFFEDQLVPFYRNGQMEDIYWTFSYSPAFGDSGINGVFVACFETTQKVTTVKKLEASQRQFQNLIREATIGIIVLIGKEKKVEIVNESYGRLIDRTIAELEGALLWDVIPEVEAEFDPLLESVRLTGNPVYLYDHPYTVFAGEKKIEGFLHVVYQPYREEDGTITGVMALCQDVTAQVKAHKKVQESEQKARAIVESAPFPIGVYTGKEMLVEMANKAIMDVWGKGYDVAGKLYAEILPELRNQLIFEQLDNVYKTGIPFHARGQRVDLVVDGSLQSFYFNYSFTPLFDTEGKVYGVMNTAAEVTDLHRTKQKIEEVVSQRTAELAKANENLKRSNEELAQFAYIASHDLQEPARKVSIFIQMLESELTEKSERSRHYLDKIKKSSDRMLTLVRDVLSYSQLSQDYEGPAELDLNEVLNDVTSDFELLILQKEAKINYSQLPRVKAIPLQMSLLFGNLISNALKFSKAGKKPVIKITSEPLSEKELQILPQLDNEKSYHHIKVIDNGIGFSQENAENIFNIFQRLHGKNEFEGTGIGLATCRKIGRNHNGHIYASSATGEGAVFHIILPAI